MYEQERAAAKLDFVQRFVWNNEDVVLLRARDESEAAKCMWDDCQQAGVNRIHDYEDDVSGGAAVCAEHSSELVFETGPIRHEWVTQVAEDAWNGIGSAAGNGWSGLWMLFAPEGRYRRFTVLPHRNEDGTWNHGELDPSWPEEPANA